MALFPGSLGSVSSSGVEVRAVRTKAEVDVEALDLG